MRRSAALRHASRALVASAFAASVALASGDCFARDPAAAQSLFDDARRLMSEGHYAEACPKLEESERLDSGMGTLFQLGVCYEHVGRTASAWAAFVEVAGRAKAAGQVARERAARDRAGLLEPTVPRLLIGARARGTDAIAGLEVRRDGELVGRGQWETAVPVDPGDHRIVASAPGRKTWEVTVSVRPDAKIVSVIVPRLEEDAAPVAASSVSTFDTSSGSAQRTVGAILIGGGAASLATGVAFAFGSMAAKTASSPHCDGNVCDVTGVQRRDDARTYGDIATVTLGVGAAVFIGGIITYLAAPSAASHVGPAAARRAQIAPIVGPRMSGIGLGGSF